MHCLAAVLVACILRRLKIPGAYLAAAIFALHPVQVESVAWISELKNTLSGVFYLAAAMAYLRFCEARETRLPPKPFSPLPWYYAALGLFVLGLLSKTVTATLPAALLVVLWWRRGRLSWRRDVLPLLPFLILGAAAGVMTAWVEAKLIGAEGAAFEMTIVQRFLLAGRAVWFYLATLAWPSKLLFFYPRWVIDPAVWWQYLFPAAALALLAVLWHFRRLSRGPLAGVLFFAGTLFPVLGFFNVFPFLYSYVADHFQYLASLGIITLAAAAMAVAFGKRTPPAGCVKGANGARVGAEAGSFGGPARRCFGAFHAPYYFLSLALLATLGGLTWRQCGMYADIVTLYRQEIQQNPDCWMAYNNLGIILAGQGKTDDALRLYSQALKIKRDYAEVHNNISIILAGRGELERAIAELAAAVKAKPDYAVAYNNLGVALASRGQVGEAAARFQDALKFAPDYAEAHCNLAMALIRLGRTDQSIAECVKALELRPNYPDAYNNWGMALASRGQIDEAMAQYHRALAIQPDYPVVYNNLGVASMAKGRADEAIEYFRKALDVKAEYCEALRNLGLALVARGGTAEVIARYEKRCKSRPAAPRVTASWAAFCCNADGSMRPSPIIKWP